MTEIKGTPVQIMADFKELQAVFADMITIEATPEVVYINFLQTFPNGRTEEVPPEMANNAPVGRVGKIVSRVALTWPHFARISTILSDTVNQSRQAATEAFMNFVVNKKI